MPRFGLTGQQISYDYYPNKRADAPVLVLQHGFTASSVTWNANIANLRKNYSVLLVDLLGHGGSDAPPDPGLYRPERAVERLAGLFDQLAIGRAVFCGHSLGGALALRFALDHPERLHGLVIINSNSAAGSPQWRNEVRPGMINLAERVNAEGTAFLKKTRLYPGQGKRLDRKSRTALMKAFDSLKPAGLANTARSLVVDVNAAERLGELRVPLLIVIGTRDAEFAANAPAFIAQFPPHLVQVVTLDDAGHAANIEKPKEFETALLSFTDSLGPIPPRPAPGTSWAPVAAAVAAAPVAVAAPPPPPPAAPAPATTITPTAEAPTAPALPVAPIAAAPEVPPAPLTPEPAAPTPAPAAPTPAAIPEAEAHTTAPDHAGSLLATDAGPLAPERQQPLPEVPVAPAAAVAAATGDGAKPQHPGTPPDPVDAVMGDAALVASATLADATLDSPPPALTPPAAELAAAADASPGAPGAAVSAHDGTDAVVPAASAAVAAATVAVPALPPPPVVTPPPVTSFEPAGSDFGGTPPPPPPVALGGDGEGGGEKRKRPRGLLIVMGATLVAAGVGMFIGGALLLDRGSGSKPPVEPASTTSRSTATPTHTQTAKATATATNTATASPSTSPSATASASATRTATATPTRTLTPAPTPTRTPTTEPTDTPTRAPTSTPTATATAAPPTPTPTATPPGPQVGISGASAAPVGGLVSLLMTASPAPITIQWFPGGGTIVNGSNQAAVTLSFPSAGCYSVQAVAVYSDGNQTRSHSVAVGGASC